MQPQPYRHDDGGEEGPAQLPPDAGPGAHHLLDVVIETVHTCNRGARAGRTAESWGPQAAAPSTLRSVKPHSTCAREKSQAPPGGDIHWPRMVRDRRSPPTVPASPQRRAGSAAHRRHLRMSSRTLGLALLYPLGAVAPPVSVHALGSLGPAERQGGAASDPWALGSGDLGHDRKETLVPSFFGSGTMYTFHHGSFCRMTSALYFHLTFSRSDIKQAFLSHNGY